MAETAWNPDLFSAQAASRVAAALGSAPDAASLARAVSECAAAAEAACQGREAACAPGCPHCCVLNVAVLLPEALVIAGWLQERLAPARLDTLQRELSRHRCWARWMDDEERIAKQVACPFLDPAGNCSIHPVRPLSCRGVTSLDSAACREALAPGYAEEAPLVVADLLRRAAHEAGFRVLAQALKLRGVDDRSIELGSGVLAFLEDPARRDLLLGGQRLPDHLWQA